MWTHHHNSAELSRVQKNQGFLQGSCFHTGSRNGCMEEMQCLILHMACWHKVKGLKNIHIYSKWQWIYTGPLLTPTQLKSSTSSSRNTKARFIAPLNHGPRINYSQPQVDFHCVYDKNKHAHNLFLSFLLCHQSTGFLQTPSLLPSWPSTEGYFLDRYLTLLKLLDYKWDHCRLNPESCH